MNDLCDAPAFADQNELKDKLEACTWYRDHWTDGNRNIIRSSTQDFASQGQ